MVLGFSDNFSSYISYFSLISRAKRYCINLKLVVVLRVLSELRVLLSVLSVEKSLANINAEITETFAEFGEKNQKFKLMQYHIK